MNANTIGMLIIMIIYLGAMVLIGILFSAVPKQDGLPSDLLSELI